MRDGEASHVCEDQNVRNQKSKPSETRRKRLARSAGEGEGEPGEPRSPWLAFRLSRFEPGRLRELMERAGIENPNQLAVQVGFGKDDPGRWLKGMEPSIQNLFQLAVFFRVSPTYFYTLSERSSEPPATMSIDIVRHALGPQHAEILEAFDKADEVGKKMLLAAARSLIH